MSATPDNWHWLYFLTTLAANGLLTWRKIMTRPCHRNDFRIACPFWGPVMLGFVFYLLLVGTNYWRNNPVAVDLKSQNIHVVSLWCSCLQPEIRQYIWTLIFYKWNLKWTFQFWRHHVDVTGDVTLPISGMARFVVSGFWLFVLVLMGIYNSRLMSYLTIVERKLPFTTLNGALRKGYTDYFISESTLHRTLFEVYVFAFTVQIIHDERGNPTLCWTMAWVAPA